MEYIKFKIVIMLRKRIDHFYSLNFYFLCNHNCKKERDKISLKIITCLFYYYILF